MVDVAPPASAAHTNRPRGRIDMHVVDGRKVDNQSIVADAESAGVMASTADRDPHLIIAAETHRGHDVRHIGALGDQSRLAADHGIVNLPGALVTRVLRLNQFSAKLTTELRHCLWFQHIPSSAAGRMPYVIGWPVENTALVVGRAISASRPRASFLARQAVKRLRQPALAAHSLCSVVCTQQNDIGPSACLTTLI